MNRSVARRAGGFSLLCALYAVGGFAAQAPPDPLDAVRQALAEASGGPVTVRASRHTGLATFVRAPEGIPVAGATPEDRARAFLGTYASAFGLVDASELQHVRSQVSDRVGMDHVRYRQLHQGVRVTGAELIVHLRSSHVTAVNGRTLGTLAGFSTTPGVRASAATAAASAALSKHLGVSDAVLSEPRLEIFDRGLIGGPPVPTRLAWFVEATREDVRQFIWVDAETGGVLVRFSQLAHALSRRIYDANNGSKLPGVLVRSEGQGATNDPDADLAYDYSGDTYDYFSNEHGRDSYDDKGAQLKSTVHFCPGPADCPYANAFWNGTQMVYGEGYSAADDVDAHELTHAVTDTSAGLFYYMQSGALNESFSDIFGETVDLTNGAGDDTPGVRWLMGEDVPGLGAIRNMTNPNQFGDPARVGDAGFFKCLDSGEDAGGVHQNSGVPNHAYALMVDGGTYNGITVSPIGTTKAGLIQYRSLTSYLGSASDFLENHDALNQSCQDLIGTGGITPADCVEVQDALNAVEMSDPWPCAPAQPLEPAACPAGQGPVNAFFDNLENTKSGNWAAAFNVGGNHWSLISPRFGTPPVYFNQFATSGQYHFWAYDVGATGDSHLKMNKSVVVPASARMRFNHSWGFENDGNTYYDGGVLEFSTNNGATWTDAGALISDGADYNGAIVSGQGNPLAGRNAFVNESWGYTTTQLDLAPLAGQSVRFRFRIGTDPLVEDYGWFIDDVRIYTCDVGGTVEFAAPVYSGSEPGKTASISVTRSGGLAEGVTLDYFSTDGTASAPGDYTAVSGTLSFGSGVTSQSFSVPLVNDTLDDDAETVGLSLTNVTGPSAVLGLDQATLVVGDDDVAGSLQFKLAAYSVSEGSAFATITVTRSGGSASSVTVDYHSTDGTATSPGDYGAVTGTLTFGTKVMSQTFTVPIVPDTLDELNETLTLTLSNPDGGGVLGGITQATLTITDNDSGGTLQIGAATYSVSEAGPVATITVTRTYGLASNVTVNYATADGTGKAGADYTASSGLLTFNANDKSKTFTVPILEDTAGENNETVLLSISTPTGGAKLGARTTAVLTILENETVLQFSVAQFSVAETSPKVTITVKRSGDTTTAVSVPYITADATAQSALDYVAASGTLVFPAKATSKTFTVSILPDALVEGSERVSLSLLPPTGGVLGPLSAATLTITDDEPQLYLSAASYSVNEGMATATITVKRAGSKTPAVSVDYATSDGTATEGADYTEATGTLSFASGKTSLTFTVPIIGDTDAEPAETVHLTLGNPQGASLGLSSALLTITDNEPTLAFSMATYSASETAATATITVKRTGSTAGTSTVDYAITDGTAQAGSDYTAVPPTGTLTFAPKGISQTFAVTILQDVNAEPTETVNLALSNVSAGTGLGLANATLNITNDDPSISFNAAAATVKEALKSVTVTVKRTGVITGPASVDYATSDGSASAGADYTAASGTLSFAPKVATRSFVVTLLPDTLDESNETIELTLSNPSGGVLGEDEATITITDDDTAGTIELAAPSFSGSEAGGEAVITVKRSGGTASGASVQYATSDGTADAGADYTATAGTLTFLAGETSKTFGVPILGDGDPEPTETFDVTLSNPGGGATLGAQAGAVTYIVSAEALPVLSIGNATVTEGNSGTTNADFTVTLTPAFAEIVTVEYTTANGTATAPSDYTTVSGTLTFNPTETTQTVSVPVVGDTDPEANETFFVNLSNPSNATLGDAQGLGTINNDDVILSVASINDVARTEGNSGTSNATFTVTLSPPAQQTVTIQYATADDTANAPGDYTAVSGTLTFTPGAATRTVSVPIKGDDVEEANETYFVNLSNPTGTAVIGDGQGLGTITNDDCLDSDGDRLCNAYETDTGVYVSPTDTGTDPADSDTDDDQLPDGDEVLGTLAGLNLPVMGTNPLKKNILLEYDWMNDSQDGCGAHSHRPTQQMVDRVSAAFLAAPVSNPDGSTGIVMIHDFGQGGAFTGGNLIPDADGNITGGVNGADFQSKKAAHFAANRNGYFHYVINPHWYTDGLGSSGQAELPGDDLIVSLGCFMLPFENTSNTIMHELGHNLNLQHGGNTSCNWKPNYNSVMNYRFQFPGVDTDCDAVGNSGEANTLDYARGLRIALNELNLNENLGSCGGANPIDWNFSGNIQAGVVYDLNRTSEDGSGPFVDNSGCVADLTTLSDYNDWANILLTGLGDTDGQPLRPFVVIDCNNPTLRETRPR